MHNHPSLSELIEAVKHFVDETAAPDLTGHGKFHARVASNVLAMVLRELEQGAAAQTVEAENLARLLGTDAKTDITTQTQALCDKIASGDFTPETPGLLEHLKRTAIAQLKIDQPNYSGLKATMGTIE